VPTEIRPPIKAAVEIKPQPTRLTSKKASLIGHLIGDGSVRGENNTIRYTNTCLKLVLKVAKAFSDVYGLQRRISERNGIFQVDWCSKKALEDLCQYTSYRCKEWRIPKEIFENPRVLGPPFLRALFDDDGCVVLCSSSKHKSWQRRVCLRSTSNQGCEDVTRLLSLLGINSRVIKWAVIISGKGNVKRFQSRVGFTQGVKVQRGSWKGMDKAKVLELLLASYEDPSAPLHQFE
jgi:intein/homing endonuclease